MRYLLLCLLCLATPAVAEGFGFRTPSGNIYCNGSMFGGARLDCSIVNREQGSAPAAVGACPAGRELDVAIDQRGPVRVSCGPASGRLSTYTDIAEYGVTGQFDAITCMSRSSGFQCTNADGHGFVLSRRSQKVY